MHGPQVVSEQKPRKSKPAKSRTPEPGRYLAGSEEAAAYLKDTHGFPVTPNLIDKSRHAGTGPVEDGTWGKWKLYSPPNLLKWARGRFRPLVRG
jgi:hypothetical protein